MNNIMKSRVRTAVRLALVTATISQATPVFAADTSDQSLEEVVVTAQRRTESIQQVPLAITVATTAELERAGINDIRDLGNLVPGLNFSTQGPFASATIRGVQSMIHQSGADMPVAIYVDGVYQNNHTTSIMELADISQVEVLKGPQGTLFGRNATGGAIIVHTLDPQFESQGKIAAEYGQFNGSDQKSGDVVLKGFFTAPLIADKLAFSVSGYRRDLAGFTTNDNDGGRSGGIESYAARAKLLFQPVDSAKFLLTFTKSNTDDLYSGGTTARNGVSVTSAYPDGLYSNQPWHVASNLYRGSSPIYSSVESIALKAEITFKLGTLTSVTAHTDNTSRYEVDLDTGNSAACKATFACLDFLENSPNKNFQQEFVFTSEKFGKVSVLAGATYFSNNAIYDAVVQPALAPDGQILRPETSTISFTSLSAVKSRAWGMFGEVNYDFTDRLHGIFGVRYSKERTWGEGSAVPRFPTTGDENNSAVTPRLSMIYNLADSTNVYFTFQKGFKTAVIPGFEQSNNVAHPESIKSYEVGMKTSGENYRVSAAAFVYDYRNQQAQFWNGTASVLGNSEKTKMAGGEVEGTYRFDGGLTLQGGLSWLPKSSYGRFEGLAYFLPMTAGGMTGEVIDLTGHRTIKSPKTTANLTLAYTAETAIGEISPSVSVFHTSGYWFDVAQRVTQGAYTTIAAQATFKPASSTGLELAVFARNLTNEKFFTSSLLGPTADAPVYSAPRSIGISASYSF